MYKTVPGGREPAPSHPLDELIRFQPNSWQTAIEFWEMMLLHAALRGTAYAEIVPGARGAVDQLLPLHTDRVRPQRLPGGDPLPDHGSW
jgi:phage portal protein BeeE